MKNFSILGVYWEIWFLGGGIRKTNINGDSLKRGAWTVCRFKGSGNLARKREGCFWGGWYPNAHYVTRLHTIYLFFKQNLIFEKKKFVRKELPVSACVHLWYSNNNTWKDLNLSAFRRSIMVHFYIFYHFR